jgi:hypothetical protein
MVKNYCRLKIVKNNEPDLTDLVPYWPMLQNFWRENIAVRLPWNDFAEIFYVYSNYIEVGRFYKRFYNIYLEYRFQ